MPRVSSRKDASRGFPQSLTYGYGYGESFEFANASFRSHCEHRCALFTLLYSCTFPDRRCRYSAHPGASSVSAMSPPITYLLLPILILGHQRERYGATESSLLDVSLIISCQTSMSRLVGEHCERVRLILHCQCGMTGQGFVGCCFSSSQDSGHCHFDARSVMLTIFW